VIIYCEEAKVSLDDDSVSIVDDAQVDSQYDKELDSDLEIDKATENSTPEDPTDLA